MRTPFRKHLTTLLALLAVALVTGLFWPGAGLLAQGSGNFFTIDQGLGNVTLWSGGKLNIKSGAELQIDGTAITASAAELNATDGVTASAAELSIMDGVTASTAELNITDGVTKTAAQINALVGGVAGSYKLARGQATTASATDTITSGLTTVVSVVCTPEDDPIDGFLFVSCALGDQAGAPAAGAFVLKTWKSADGTDPTPTAATSFSKKVNWIAIGT